MKPAESKLEYRVVYKREGLDPKRKRFVRRAGADRFLILLGPEPWVALGKDPDDLQCCNGEECGCGGVTVRESNAAYREEMPALEWVRVEERPVGLWREVTRG